MDDNNDISPDGGVERVSDGVPAVPETTDEESARLMDASTVAMGRATDADTPFPQIDGYEIIEAMQAGGQGKLYKARELGLTGREVVLKFPRAGVLSSDRAVALFENEVQKAASLDHPNIARIYSSGLYDRMPFYSMEFIDGVDLGEHVAEASLGQREILELVRTICLAVQHAHQRQIVHRDLKPANIMVTRDGAVPKLLDFGLAIEETELQATIDRGVGTLVYMSPEQAAYEPVTTQTDVYSLGVILYELLTGEHPNGFTQQDMRTLTPGQFRDRVANGEVIRPRRVSDQIDRELEALLLKALAHESSDRYVSAGYLAADIGNYLDGEPLAAKKPTTFYFLRKRIRVRHMVLGCTVLAAIIGVLIWGNGFRSARNPNKGSAITIKGTGVTPRPENTNVPPDVGTGSRIPVTPAIPLQRIEKVVFEDTFDNNTDWQFNDDYTKPNFADYPGIRGWENGPISGGKHLQNRPYLNIVDGMVFGCSEGYGKNPQAFEPTAMHRKLDLDGSNGFSVEFRAISAANSPNSVEVCLLSDWKKGKKRQKYYGFRIYGESSAHCIDIATTSLDSFSNLLYRCEVGSLVNKWHAYVFQRSADGQFELLVDGKKLKSFKPPPDRTYNHFNRIAINTLRRGSKIDWVRVKSLAQPRTYTVTRPEATRGKVIEDNKEGGKLNNSEACWDGNFETYAEVKSNGNGLEGIGWESTETYRVPRGARNIRFHAKTERCHWQSLSGVYVYNFIAGEYDLMVSGSESDEGIQENIVNLASKYVKDGEVRVRAYLFAKHSEKAYARYYETEIIYE